MYEGAEDLSYYAHYLLYKFLFLVLQIDLLMHLGGMVFGM